MAPLPVLAVSPAGLRRVGLVVLDRRSRLRTAKLPFLRRHKDHDARLDVILREVTKLLIGLNITCLVLDAGAAQRPRLARLCQALRRLCQEENIWLREVRLASAMHFLGDSDRGRLALSLAASYSELAKRLDFSGHNPLGSIDRAREQRPIIDAFILAYAVAVEARGAGPVPNGRTTEPL